MTDDEIRIYANNLEVWAKKMRTALNDKKKDIKRAEDNTGISESASTEILNAHNTAILDLSNSVPTEQEAIDQLASEL